MGNLSDVSLTEAVGRSRKLVAHYPEEKQARVTRGEFNQADHFPCCHCLKHLGKTSWLKNFPEHPWAHQEDATMGRIHDHT
jgi:hypothetical protein